ncbi:MAG TPA: hypothetical protein VGF94_19940 [Kofleriaceae bacterium]|jgi:hypothetical protein
MHVSFGHALVGSALVASIVLLLHREDRLFPALALVASGLEALMVFHVIELSSGKLRIDAILPALLMIAGAVCWARDDTKPSITAATVATLVGALQLLLAFSVMS